jgi:hypothetical protein
MSNEEEFKEEDRDDDQDEGSPSEYIRHMPPQLLRAHPINEKIYGSEIVDPNLLQSISEGGIIEELQITADYIVVSGHRRRACAIELGLESVPVRIRYDLDTDEKVVWALIEANRTQRDKTLEQKVREIYEINERLKKFRAEMSARHGITSLKDIAAFNERLDPGELHIENPEQLQEFVKDNYDPKTSKVDTMLSVALKHYGISDLHWKKARKAIIAIEEFEAADRMSDAKEARRALNTLGFKRFDKVIDRLRGVQKIKKFERPTVLMKRSIEAFEQSIKFFSEDSSYLARANIALGIMKTVKEELARMAPEIGPSTEKVKIDADHPDEQGTRE